MNKRGFTFVELLVAMVLMGMILLIVVPNLTGLMKQMDNNRYQTFLNDVYLATEAYIQKNNERYLELQTNGIAYVYLSNLVSSHYLKSTVVNPKNDEPISNELYYTVVVSKKEDYGYNYELKEDLLYYQYLNGNVIYYNPEAGRPCQKNQSVSITGTKTGCMKWYTFNDNSESSTVNMLLDHNTTATTAWNTSTLLASDTSTWLSYLNPRLISASEIVAITNNQSFQSNSSSSWFYLDSNDQIQTITTKGSSNYSWLYDYTKNCASYGCNLVDASNYGYWTSSSVGDDITLSWGIDREGKLVSEDITEDNYYGIRPVITVAKQSLK